MLHHALFYLKNGISIVPAKGKIPMVKWSDYQVQPPDEKTVFEWWKRWPHANIAIVCGKASQNLCVVDIDGPEAKENFKKLNFPLNTWIVRTDRGWHVYYKASSPVTSSKLSGFEIKGHGSVVIAPPSVHPSGKRYAWVLGHTPSDHQIASITIDNIMTNDSAKQTAVKELLGAYKGVSEGIRNTTLTKLVGLWFRLGMDLKEATETALTWNQLNTPPLSEKEVITTIQSIYKNEIKKRQEVRDYVKKLTNRIPLDINIPTDIARRISIYDLIISQQK